MLRVFTTRQRPIECLTLQDIFRKRATINRAVLREMTCKDKVHPKTLIEMWITCLDPVSANSEKCIGSQWAVRVGQRLQSRFGKSGAARKLGVVQVIVEAAAVRGGFRDT